MSNQFNFKQFAEQSNKAFADMLQGLQKVETRVAGVETKVSNIESKVDFIIEQINKKAQAQNQAPDQNNQGITKCDCCGVVIRSAAVVQYCKSRKFDGVYCTKCQENKGLTGKKFRGTATNNNQQPASKGFKAGCSCCGKTMFFDTAEQRTAFYERAIAKGYKGYVCKPCVTSGKAQPAQVQEQVQETDVLDHNIEMPQSVAEKIQDTQDRAYNEKFGAKEVEAQRNADRVASKEDMVQSFVTIARQAGLSQEDILAMGIKDVRAYLKENGVELVIDGNVWNRTKAVVVEAAFKAEDAPAEEVNSQVSLEEVTNQETQQEAPRFKVLPENCEEEGEEQDF